MNTNGSGLTLNDLGDLLERWRSVNLVIPSEIQGSPETDEPAPAYPLAQVLASLYMRRQISFDELCNLAEQITERQAQWESVCYGIGMEAGLGLISEDDVPAYLTACNRPFGHFLRDLHARSGEPPLFEPTRAADMGKHLERHIHEISVAFAKQGYTSAQAKPFALLNSRSMLAEFFGESDVFMIQAAIPDDCPAG